MTGMHDVPRELKRQVSLLTEQRKKFAKGTPDWVRVTEQITDLQMRMALAESAGAKNKA
jgi:hypothetical protein